MLKNDLWINQKASEGMIKPFQSNLVRHLEPDNKQKPVLSYGCSSYGYDLRLSSKEFLIFRHIPGTVMNPKKFNPNNLEKSIYESTNELWNFCKKELQSGENDQIILDEIFLAIEMKIIEKDDLISTLENRFISGDVILTGTDIPKDLLLMANQITELRS